MGTAWNWSPFFDALQGGIQQIGGQNQYKDALAALTSSNQINPVTVTPQVSGPGMPSAPGATPITDPARAAAANMPIESMNNPLGNTTAQANVNRLAPLLQHLQGATGMPLLLQAATAQPEYDPTPHIGINPATGQSEQFLINKANGQPIWTGIAATPKIRVSNTGVAYDTAATAPGTQVGQAPKQPNNLMAVDGSIYDTSDPKHPKLITTAPNRTAPKPPTLAGAGPAAQPWTLYGGGK